MSVPPPALHLNVADLRDGVVVESCGYSAVLEGTKLSLMRSPQADARRYCSIDVGHCIRYEAQNVDALYLLLAAAEDPSAWFGATTAEERARVETLVRELAARLGAALAA